jgi:hypothetical protein
MAGMADAFPHRPGAVFDPVRERYAREREVTRWAHGASAHDADAYASNLADLSLSEADFREVPPLVRLSTHAGRVFS